LLKVYRGIAEMLENYGASVVPQMLNELAEQLESRDGVAYLRTWRRLEHYLTEGD